MKLGTVLADQMRACHVTIGTASAEVRPYHLRTMKKLAILVLLTSLSATAQMKYGVVVMAPSDANASELFHGEPGVLIRNDEVFFALGNPKGWAIDRESGADRGIGAIFYPKDASSSARIYVDTLKKPGADITAESVMKEEVAATEKARKVEIQWLADVKTSGPEKARLVLIRAETHSLIVAYIDQPKGIVKLVLAAVDSKDLKDATPVFHSFIGSFHPLKKTDLKIIPPEK